MATDARAVEAREARDAADALCAAAEAREVEDGVAAEAQVAEARQRGQRVDRVPVCDAAAGEQQRVQVLKSCACTGRGEAEGTGLSMGWIVLHAWRCTGTARSAGRRGSTDLAPCV